MEIKVTKNPNKGTLPPSDKLGFGHYFTDHMFVMDYSDAEGWHDARIVPLRPHFPLPRRERLPLRHRGL